MPVDALIALSAWLRKVPRGATDSLEIAIIDIKQFTTLNSSHTTFLIPVNQSEKLMTKVFITTDETTLALMNFSSGL